MTQQPFPQFMERGSNGPHVDIYLRFLATWAVGIGQPNHGLVFDGNYGGKGAEWTRALQADSGLEADGGVGPTTRKALWEKYQFDFASRAMMVVGTSYFVQPDGSTIEWTRMP